MKVNFIIPNYNYFILFYLKGFYLRTYKVAIFQYNVTFAYKKKGYPNRLDTLSFYILN
ncbi:hypothetical protein predicted by Glimmer/Critica [Bacteroides ovatus V975]|uniref:Uncharacterized protein n=1 Tax=Bacteroides ovatus (strain ATCC 8483 / DSM 1896 / JCM 5824 / BCRC 10623 / CCUG 4943 / NCTC 11153) TaxID=411476 RepID=A0AAN3D9P1_BACO1|nr:hypothetical protein BACOVA_00652 [Bacteroides ovatus ATCC 8483]SCV11085.1 hypothetical protein predicted by Glimmer/Critica [Bacteroides ovatus V975]